MVVPLASIVARRSPMVEGSSDVADALVAVIGGVGYVIKSMRKWRDARRERKRTSGFSAQAEHGGTPATPAPAPTPAAEPLVHFDPSASPISGLGTHAEHASSPTRPEGYA